jgi:hypothetical protein
VTTLDNFDDLRELCDRPDSWIQVNSIYGGVVVASQRLSLLLAAFDAERRRRSELERRLAEAAAEV